MNPVTATQFHHLHTLSREALEAKGFQVFCQSLPCVVKLPPCPCTYLPKGTLIFRYETPQPRFVGIDLTSSPETEYYYLPTLNGTVQAMQIVEATEEELNAIGADIPKKQYLSSRGKKIYGLLINGQIEALGWSLTKKDKYTAQMVSSALPNKYEIKSYLENYLSILDQNAARPA